MIEDGTRSSSSHNSIASTRPMNWLIQLRWYALAAQFLMLIIGRWGLDLAIPPLPYLTLVSVTLMSNLWLWRNFAHKEDTQSAIYYVLFFDPLILTGLLLLSGGSANPFSIMYLVHVVLAALLLGSRQAWQMAILAAICFGSLFLFALEIPGMQMHQHSNSLSLHLEGMWLAFVVVALLCAYFLSRICAALHEKERQLHLLRLNGLKQEQLAALTTLAAGAAHELGSPLSTIAIAAADLVADKNLKDPEIKQDLALIQSQVLRCKEILAAMSLKSGSIAGEMPEKLSIEHFCSSLQADLKPSAQSLVQFATTCGDKEIQIPAQTLRRALGSLISNALDASDFKKAVKLLVETYDNYVRFQIIDHGSGMSLETLNRIGEPFFSTKQAGQGMGLGIFLAKLTAERLGGKLGFESQLGSGTRVTLILPIQINS